jgi:hypothetical protein
MRAERILSYLENQKKAGNVEQIQNGVYFMQGFKELGKFIEQQDFVHNDLKPRNIMVREMPKGGSRVISKEILKESLYLKKMQLYPDILAVAVQVAHQIIETTAGTSKPVALFVAQDKSQLAEIVFDTEKYMPIVVLEQKDALNEVANIGITVGNEPVFFVRDGIPYIYVSAHGADYAQAAKQVVEALMGNRILEANHCALKALGVKKEAVTNAVVFDCTGTTVLGQSMDSDIMIAPARYASFSYDAISKFSRARNSERMFKIDLAPKHLLKPTGFQNMEAILESA